MTLVKGLFVGSLVVALLPIGLLSARVRHPKPNTQTAPVAPAIDTPVPTPAMTESFASIQLAAAIPVKAAAPVKATGVASPPPKRAVVWRAPSKISPRAPEAAKPSTTATESNPKMSDDNPYPRSATPKMRDERPFGVGS